MNSNIKKIHRIAQKPERLVIGLMSGTSFDGLDIALCKIKGSGRETSVALLNFETVKYDSDLKNEIRAVFSNKNAGLEQICLLNEYIAIKHAGFVNDILQKWKINNEEIDLLASHGQTIYHAPKTLHKQRKFSNATLQIGDGDHLAVRTGIITISDFRQKHIAAGGEGAPLALYGDYLLFSKEGEHRIMLNIGGIANFTYLPGDNSEQVFSTDTGPGNTMMDAYIQKNFPGTYFDENGRIAAKGNVNSALLHELKAHPFFELPLPKTTGPELFNLQYLENALEKISETSLCQEDVLATLNKFSADTIVLALDQCFTTQKEFKIFVSGGGMHNQALLKNIRVQLPGIMLNTTDELFLNPDAKEAVLFALLANESICGNSTKTLENLSKIPKVAMGKISFPQ